MLQYFPMSKSLQFTYVFDDLENSIDDVSEALFFGVSATGKDINVSSMIISIWKCWTPSGATAYALIVNKHRNKHIK